MPQATPKSHLIQSYRDAGGTALWWLLLEAADNSFDAGATNIVIYVGAEEITIVDDGGGLTKETIVAPIVLGDHRIAGGPALGRFGVGITAQAIKHGDVLEIDTISRDGRGSICANWDAMLKRGDWHYDDPTWKSARGEPRRTIVKIRKLLKKPKAKDIERAIDEMAQRFYPALANRRQIKVNNTPVPLFAEPVLTDRVRQTLTFPDGRTAEVWGGLLAPNQVTNRLCRVHVSYLHRVIKPNCAFGCNGYSGLEGMFARISLSDNWRLTQFKDDIIDSDELEDRVQGVLEPILRKCHARSMSIDLQQTIDAVHELLGEESARPVHKKPPGPALPSPKRPPKERVVPDAPFSPTGPVKRPKPRNKIQVEFPVGETEAEQYGVGTVDMSQRVHRILLPRENPYIADLLSERDIARRAKLIHVHAMMIYEQGNLQSDLEFGRLVWEKIKNTTIRQDQAVAA